jgi:hypothetical protein
MPLARLLFKRHSAHATSEKRAVSSIFPANCQKSSAAGFKTYY